MATGESVPSSGDRVSGSASAGPAADRDSEAPTPPTGLPLIPPLGSAVPSAAPQEDGTSDDETPPSGIEGLSGVVNAEDFGSGGPAVLGGADPIESESHDDVGDWPTLEYRSRARSKRTRGTFDWLRGREAKDP